MFYKTPLQTRSVRSLVKIWTMSVDLSNASVNRTTTRSGSND